MDNIKSTLTHALVGVDRARNYHRDHGCDPELRRLILEAKCGIDDAAAAIFIRTNNDRARTTRVIPDDQYPEFDPAGFLRATYGPADAGPQ